MAGERIGKTYEAYLKVVLEMLKENRKIKGNIFWNETPEGLSVEPDFVIGGDKDHPEIIIMVTHSGSSKNSDMKCWRNLGELCESKTVLNEQPKALNVVFDGTMKTTLKDMQDAAFDGQIIVSDKVYGESLKKWIHKTESSLPTEQEAKVTEIKKVINQEPIKELTALFTTDINILLDGEQPELQQLWNYERTRPIIAHPTAKQTSIRRGISKLWIFEEIHSAIRFYRGEKVDAKTIPPYAVSLGLVAPSLSGFKPNDVEISNAVRLLSDADIQMLYDSISGNEVVDAWIYQLRNIDTIEYMGKYVLEFFDAICDSEKLYHMIIELHDNPEALVCSDKAPECWPPHETWIVSYLMEIIKTYSNKSNGYGIAQLGIDVVDAGFGDETDLASAGQFGGGFLSTWLMRKESPFRLDLLEGIAVVLSDKMKEIGFPECKKLIENKAVEKSLVNNLIEAKLCTYRMFEPLYLLINKEIPGVRKVQYRTCFAERAGLGGQTGKTTVAQVKKTIINWQSATDAGRDHKRKELCGRAVGLRYSWDSEKGEFIKRPGVEKLVLVLDGTWRQTDIDLLIKAGWDEIYYPDEINQLKDSIV